MNKSKIRRCDYCGSKNYNDFTYVKFQGFQFQGYEDINRNQFLPVELRALKCDACFNQKKEKT